MTKQTLVTNHPERKVYWKSLLQINMPVSVTLARKSIRTEDVIQLVPGTMLHFSMTCDKPLTLEVDDQTIARGDVVKVGDKFGLKLLSIEPLAEQWKELKG
jgi:flagellar motor switch protein FliN